jgi:hypothetical protein
MMLATTLDYNKGMLQEVENLSMTDESFQRFMQDFESFMTDKKREAVLQVVSEEFSQSAVFKNPAFLERLMDQVDNHGLVEKPNTMVQFSPKKA